ncbi:MAG: hypothetical protein D6698_09790, partial [Gammaproteobacteria bacterium]
GAFGGWLVAHGSWLVARGGVGLGFWRYASVHSGRTLFTLWLNPPKLKPPPQTANGQKASESERTRALLGRSLVRTDKLTFG